MQAKNIYLKNLYITQHTYYLFHIAIIFSQLCTKNLLRYKNFFLTRSVLRTWEVCKRQKKEGLSPPLLLLTNVMQLA